MLPGVRKSVERTGAATSAARMKSRATAREDSSSPAESAGGPGTQMWRICAMHLQESERRRIAAELHDGLGQTLSLVKQSLNELARSPDAALAPAKLQGGLQRLSSLVTAALADMQRTAMNLQPAMLSDLGLVPTLSWYLRETQAAYPHVTVVGRIEIDEAEVPQALKLPIFRIVQEATRNALKHSRADRIKVTVAGSASAVKLCIEDNGRGFDSGEAAHRDFTHGLGLQNMQERAELSGAIYRLESTPGKGTRVDASWRIQNLSSGKCPISGLEADLVTGPLGACVSCPGALPDDGKQRSAQ